MTDSKPLISGFGFDKEAQDAANNFSESSSKLNIQRVFAILTSWKSVYKGPRNVITNLTNIARRAFSGNRTPSLPKANAPFVD